jgi:ankyrin repeat protein
VEEHNVDVNGAANDGDTVLMVAIRGSQDNIAEFLVKNHHVDVNAVMNNGSTALMWAAGNHRPTVVMLLIEHGAEVRATDANGTTALEHAVPNVQDSAWYEQQPENVTKTVDLLIRKLMTLPRNPATRTTRPSGIPLPPNRPDFVTLKETIGRTKGLAHLSVNRNPRIPYAKFATEKKVAEFLGGKRKSKKSRKRHTAKRRCTTRKRRR